MASKKHWLHKANDIVALALGVIFTLLAASAVVLVLSAGVRLIAGAMMCEPSL